ncbi:facilitated trehalose transporter Tret1-like [Chelonus insularis]|uniref:facilitated trehalose transporter Tret1-like n=1 Tax=Chelonus insularis TaxID=460826 RepID=UPI00158AC655|nr:facilitated trehalose transporter Tret1-like [Chelonus insularis]
MYLNNILMCFGRNIDECKPEKNNQKELEDQKIHPKCSQWLQFVAAISACLSVIACGGHLGWTSPALPYLTNPNNEHSITPSQGSWVVSLYTIGSIIGSLLSPFCIDRLGRKYSLLVFVLPQLAGWGLIIVAKSFIILYTARLIAGIAHGGIYNITVIYLAEIADKNIRGALGSFLKMSTNIGTLFVTTLGAYLPYSELNLVSLSVPLLFIVIFSFMPETPYFFLIKNRISDAEKSLMTLRRLKNPEDVKDDILQMKEAVDEGTRNKKNVFKELLRTRGNRRALTIILGLKSTQQFSGHIAVVAYTQEIFAQSGSSLPPDKAVVILGIFQLVAGVAAAALVDRIGRRILMIISGLSSALALIIVGIFFYMKNFLELDVTSISWLPIVALIAYDVMEVFGIGTLPYVLLGELFPTNIKGAAVASGILVGSVFATLVGLSFQAMNTALGIHWTFWIFAICCTFGTLFVYFITPETKGKTLEDIQNELNPRKKLNK